MPTAAQIIRAYTQRLRSGMLPERYETHPLGTKYIPGGEPVSGTVPLDAMLTIEFDADVHFTQYTSPAAIRCVRDNAHQYDFTFTFAAYDLDFDDHASMPQAQDLVQLARTLHIIDHTPNILYPTRGGARIIYLIEPIHDPGEFEGHYQRLMAVLAQHASKSPYKIDTAAKDWTRLFRAPSVVRDGVRAKMPALMFHDQPIDLRAFKLQPKSVRKPLVHKITGPTNDATILLGLARMAEGNRNTTVYRLLCRVRDRYSGPAADRWIEAIREKAYALDMEEREFETTYRSAFK